MTVLARVAAPVMVVFGCTIVDHRLLNRETSLDMFTMATMYHLQTSRRFYASSVAQALLLLLST
jgi:hypothetical protein